MSANGEAAKAGLAPPDASPQGAPPTARVASSNIDAITNPSYSRQDILGHGSAPHAHDGMSSDRVKRVRLLSRSCPECGGDGAPLVAKRERRRQVKDDAPHRDDDLG